MKRIAMVLQEKFGTEADLRQAQTSLPVDELPGLGIHGLEMFIGSGHCVLLLDCVEDDFQVTMQRFFEAPGVQGFLDKLRPHVDGLPARHEAFTAGDEKHEGGRAQRGMAASTVTTAQLPLAASAFAWSAGQGAGSARNGGSTNGGGRR